MRSIAVVGCKSLISLCVASLRRIAVLYCKSLILLVRRVAEHLSPYLYKGQGPIKRPCSLKEIDMNFTTKRDRCNMQNVRVSTSTNWRRLLPDRDLDFSIRNLERDLLSSTAALTASSPIFDTNLIYFNGDF